MKKIGFIGCGMMANAMMGGIIANGLCRPEDIVGADPTEAGRTRSREQNGIRVTADNRAVVQEADILFLTVKPQYYTEVIQGIRDLVREDQLVISIGAGRTLAYLEEQFGERPVRIVRVMPNTPAQVGEGMSALCPNAYATEDDVAEALALFRSFGKAEVVPEGLFDVVTGVSGSGPAYVFLFLEAMADAAVVGGMPRAQAYTFAGQTVLGAAKMMLETGKHPGELKDMVTSPAGTTIAAVRTLEERGLRQAVIEGVCAATEKSIQLQKMA